MVVILLDEPVAGARPPFEEAGKENAGATSAPLCAQETIFIVLSTACNSV
ncbi:hypothetical protein [Bradyrhizobium sp.]